MCQTVFTNLDAPTVAKHYQFCILVSQKSNPVVSTKQTASFRNQAARMQGRKGCNSQALGKYTLHVIER